MEPHGEAGGDPFSHRLGEPALHLFVIQIHREILGVEEIETVDQALAALRESGLWRRSARQHPGRLAYQPDAGRLGEVQHALALTADPEIHQEIETARRTPFGPQTAKQSLPQN